ncbi:PilW family protein [Pseudocolwellia sp. HL-MZ7]|uniref:PilW family protein n=1 Tax=Pseudocolwellia sp. HL-MZ7 TaxID=3400627 RepID=UPI003CF2EB4A
MLKKQQGFTLLEIFVALAIGLVLIGGVLSVFVGMKTTTQETSSMGELQENGRFAVSLLTDDLLRQNLWGDLSSNLSSGLLITPAPANPAGDCIGGGFNNGSFPQPGVGSFRTIWAQTVDNINILDGCIDDAVIDSDVIQIKRVVANPVAQADIQVNRYYINSGFENAAIFLGNAGAVPTVNQSRIWEYQHHVYYIREDKVGDEVIPVLMQGRLQNAGNAMSFNMLVEGIERIHYMFGVDTSGDGVINAYIAPVNMLENYWDNANNVKILAVKLYVLVRSIRPDRNYDNDNVYQMGDVSFDASGDNYRRILFSTTVSMPNATLRTF